MNNLRRIIREALKFEIGNIELDSLASKVSAEIVNYANKVIAGMSNQDDNTFPPYYEGGPKHYPLKYCRACPSYAIQNNKRVITIGDYPIAYLVYTKKHIFGIADIGKANPKRFNMANGLPEEFEDQLYNSIHNALKAVMQDKKKEYDREVQYNSDLYQQVMDYRERNKRRSRKPNIR